MRAAFAALLVSLTTLGCTEAKPTFPASVLIVRHAEKPDDENVRSLSATGKKRAEAFPDLFQKSGVRPEPFPAPDFIFAAGPSKRSDRSEETTAPLAKKLGLTVDTRFDHHSYEQLATELLTNPKYANKTVLVCWHHGKITDLAKSLKCADVPEKWKDDVFDQVWVVTYVDGKGKLTRRPQALLPGDANK